MRRLLGLSILSALLLVSSGCTTLATMTPTERIGGPANQTALVNFVRPSIFIGDGIDYEVWDGVTHLGTLKAGTMIQYLAQPGDHVFMVDPARGERWAGKKLTVEGGKTYYIKTNVTVVNGLNLGLANANDARIEKWNQRLTPLAIDRSATKPVPKENRDEAAKYVEVFRLQR